MKRMYYLLMTLAMVLVSCSENELISSEPSRGEIKTFSQFNVTMEDTPMTRTHIENGIHVAWDEGDVIGVYSDIEGVVPFTYAGNNTFTSEKSVSGTEFYAYFPYRDEPVERFSNRVDEQNKSIVHFYLPESLLLNLDSPERWTLPMVAKSSTNNLKFKQTTGLMHFTLKGKQHVSYLSLSTLGNLLPISAGWKVDFSQSEPVTTPDESTYSIHFQDVNCDIDLEEDGMLELYFPVPPGVYEEGFSFTVGLGENNEWKQFTKEINHSVEVKRGVINTFPAIESKDYIDFQQRNILKEFYDALNGDRWANHTNWNTDAPLDKWFGLTLENGEIVKIDLKVNELRGDIPESFAELQSIRYLDLQSNFSISSLPENFDNLINLEYLDLTDTNITVLPDNFGNLPSLKELEWRQCKVISLPESFGNLKSLEKLNIDSYTLSGLPNNFGNLQSLKDLKIHNAGSYRLFKELPRSFGNLNALEKLELLNIRLESLPDNFGNLSNLKYLDLSANSFKEFPEQICNLNNLETFSWKANYEPWSPETSYISLNDSIPVSIGNLKNLKKLEIVNANIGGCIPVSIGNLVNLEYLILNENWLGGYLPEEIGNLMNLKGISMHSNSLSGNIPDSFTNLRNLQTFNLCYNRLHGQVSPAIASWIEELMDNGCRVILEPQSSGLHIWGW